MNLLRIVSLFLFSTSVVLSEVIPSDSEFATMTVERAKQTITQSPRTGQRMQELAASALRSQRPDLVILYFEIGGPTQFILDGTKALPDSLFKDRIVVMMLKSSDSPYWPPGKEVLTYSNSWIPRMAEPFTSVIKKLRPDLPLSDDLLADRAARWKLALELEKAIVPEPIQPNPGGANTPPKPTSTPMPNLAEPAITNSTPLAASQDAERARVDRKVWPWVVGIAAFIAFVVFFFKRRRDR